MSRPILYDVTPFARLSVQDVGGIDRVAFAYASHFAGTSRPGIWGAYFGAVAPHPVRAADLGGILHDTKRAWRDDTQAEADLTLAGILNWLGQTRSFGQKDLPNGFRLFERTRRLSFHARHWLSTAARSLPSDAVYLNVFNAGREHRFLFDWLRRRRDVQPVFFVHDLLPFDYPEYFPPGYVELTRRRTATLAGLENAAFIAGTRSVADRFSAELRQYRRSSPPIHVAPLPAAMPAASPNPHAATRPYFMMIGTIEPRKNHLLVLNLWRQFASGNKIIPKLVIVGGPGWENEQTVDMLERCPPIQPHVLRVKRISAAGLGHLLANAQALLMPSFDEGYGLPVVEALTVGTPVIASDIPVFREIVQGCATLLPPLDGAQWADAVLALSDPQSPAWKAAKLEASKFDAPTWSGYFNGVEKFLDSL